MQSVDLNDESWISCSDYYIHPNSEYLDNLKCRFLSMPYNHENSTSNNSTEYFDYHLFRFVSDSLLNGRIHKPKGIIFGLAGGPLQDALSEMLAIGLDVMNSELSNYIWYFPDHRGTGRSDRWPLCESSYNEECYENIKNDYFGVEKGNSDLYYQFTVNNSAHDVYYSINLITEPLNSSIKIVKNGDLVRNVTSKIDTIYKQIQKNSKKPSTDYLFNNSINKNNNLEKTISKLDKLSSLEGFIPRNT